MRNAMATAKDDDATTRAPDGKPSRHFGVVAPQNYPILYINVPKSACTSIKCLIYYLDNGVWPEDPLTIHHRRDLVPGNPARADMARIETEFLFTFVRHPLKRAYSAFNEKINYIGPYSLLLARQRIEIKYGARFSDNPSIEDHRRNFLLFLQFVANMMDSGRKKNLHFAPQAHIISYMRHYRVVDFIGRVENMAEDIAFVLKKAGYGGALSVPHFNEGPPPPYSYDEMLTDEIVALGRLIYRDDFKLFGYSA
jgi:hypothetical protein